MSDADPACGTRVHLASRPPPRAALLTFVVFYLPPASPLSLSATSHPSVPRAYARPPRIRPALNSPAAAVVQSGFGMCLGQNSMGQCGLGMNISERKKPALCKNLPEGTLIQDIAAGG